MRSALRQRASALAALGVALLLAFLAMRPQLYLSWTPADEGVLAQGAERVLRGELPHRDFVDLWSGGLDYVNAAAFRMLGTSLASLRTVLAVAWLAALAATFAAARRMLSPWIAAALVVCTAVWTLPLSPHPLPSWYNLFLALGGVAAVLQWMRRPHRGWLIAAGAAAGASVAVKIVGLYFIAAVLLWFVWEVQDDVEAPPDARRSAARPYAWTISAGLLVYLAFVFQLVRSDLTVNSALHFVAPNLLLCGTLLWREWRLPAGADGARFRTLFSLGLPFAAGVALAIVPWIWPYVHGHALDALARGLFVTPRVRLLVATSPLPGLRSALFAVAPFALLITAAPFVRKPLRRADQLALAAVVVAVAAFAYNGSPLVLITWYGLRLLTPLCAALAAWWLVAPPRGLTIPRERRAILFFLVAAAVTGSLIQIPFALYTYFLYFLPLAALAITALLTSQPAMPREVGGALLAFVLLFGARGPGSLPKPSFVRHADGLAPLALARGRLTVSRVDSTTYAQLIGSITRHATGDWIYVWHDAPQLYFLAGKRNPTGTMFEVFDDSLVRRASYLIGALRARDVRLVVLTGPAGAARPMDPVFRSWLLETYPESERIGRHEVRWRREPIGAP